MAKPDPMKVLVDLDAKVTRLQTIKKFKSDCKAVGGRVKTLQKKTDVQKARFGCVIDNVDRINEQYFSSGEGFREEYGLMQIIASGKAMHVFGLPTAQNNEFKKSSKADPSVLVSFGTGMAINTRFLPREEFGEFPPVASASLEQSFPSLAKCTVQVESKSFVGEKNPFKTESNKSVELEAVGVVSVDCILKATKKK